MLLEWATMAMPDAQIEIQVKDLDADIVGWTSLISLSLDESTMFMVQWRVDSTIGLEFSGQIRHLSGRRWSPSICGAPTIAM